MESGVTTCHQQVVGAGEDGGHWGRQDEVPHQGRVQGGSLVRGHLVEAAETRPLEVILYEHVEETGAEPVLGVVDVLSVVGEGERREACHLLGGNTHGTAHSAGAARHIRSRSRSRVS